MKEHEMSYEKLIELTSAISECKDPEEVALLTAGGVKSAFDVKGCSVFLIKKGTRELGLAASFGLSDEYLNKGPVRYMQEITEAKDQVPIAIYDVQDDPRIQYPEAAKKEGISSLLGVPIIARNSVIGALRVYTSKPWNSQFKTSQYCRRSLKYVGWLWTCAACTKDIKQVLKFLRTSGVKSTSSHEAGHPMRAFPRACQREVEILFEK
jgi:transcriptional regulator with GAF, ATPase, and Fis domain